MICLTTFFNLGETKSKITDLFKDENDVLFFYESLEFKSEDIERMENYTVKVYVREASNKNNFFVFLKLVKYKNNYPETGLILVVWNG